MSTVKWFASCLGLVRSGPYASQIDAYEDHRLTADARDEQRRKHGTDSPYPIDLVVWPERVRAGQKSPK